MQGIVDFILELDRLKGVTRKTRPLGLDRHENSAEHSWQIALLARALEPYADSPVDIERVTTMLLVHDVGEIETGDTIVYAEGGWDERKRAEEAAVRRIFGILPDGRGDRFVELWLEFERSETPESRFANAVDRAMPVLLNLANHGQSWREIRCGPSLTVPSTGEIICKHLLRRCSAGRGRVAQLVGSRGRC